MKQLGVSSAVQGGGKRRGISKHNEMNDLNRAVAVYLRRETLE